MRRFQLFEIEDQPWLPNSVRDALTDYLRYITDKTQPYQPIILLLENALEQNAVRQIVDLCSGGAGPWVSLHSVLQTTPSIKVLLTDKFPNVQAFQQAKFLSNGAIDFVGKSVDAADVSNKLNGFRTLFASFHHFNPQQARGILNDAVKKKQGIAVFEATHRSLSAILLMFLIPFAVLIFTPFIRPFRPSRLLWTYLFPVVPFIVLFDGIVSCLRTYNPSELKFLTAELVSANEYVWQIGEQKAKNSPLPVTFLIGYPRGDREVLPAEADNLIL